MTQTRSLFTKGNMQRYNWIHPQLIALQVRCCSNMFGLSSTQRLAVIHIMNRLLPVPAITTINAYSVYKFSPPSCTVAQLAKAGEIYNVANDALGGVSTQLAPLNGQLTEETGRDRFLLPDTYTLFAIVHGDSNNVLGTVVVESLDIAYTNTEPREERKVKCGIVLVWVKESHRRRGLAKRLLDAVSERQVSVANRLSSFIFSYTLRPMDIAFSQPSENGKCLATSYSGPDFLVYQG